MYKRQGVRYCHSRHVTHRDLKLENTLLDSSPPLLKICDFGYCKDMVRDTPPDTQVGTPAYISPVRCSVSPETLIVLAGCSFCSPPSECIQYVPVG